MRIKNRHNRNRTKERKLESGYRIVWDNCSNGQFWMAEVLYLMLDQMSGSQEETT